jgi:protocatechuate 3,4-dioxygenase beta subunit
MNDSMSKPHWNSPGAGLRRRTLLGALGLFPVSALAQEACSITRDSGEGPFYFDPGQLRSDIREHAVGSPLSVVVRVVRESDCALLQGARFDLWQADAMGLYSGYRNQPGIPGTDATAAADLSYLRGTQITDAAGQVQFLTIFPNWYGNRTPHIHFKVFLGADEVVASQLFFPEESIMQVYNNIEPYKQHVGKRRITNESDMFLRQNPIGGVFCTMSQEQDLMHANATVVIKA